jgi:uncharacterized protein Smg (DUF494 family)
MNTDLVNILVEIVEGIHNKHSIKKILKNINKTRKVNKNLIAAIYSWIFDKITKDIADKLEGNPASAGIRLLSVEEMDIIGVENYNYILHLYNMGLLNNTDLEKILDQALTFQEGELVMDEINYLILSIFLESDSELPPGSRFLLYSSDTIN